MSQTDTIQLGVLILHRKRPGFDTAWGDAVETAARSALDSLPFRICIPDTRVSDDPSLRAAMAEIRDANANALVVLQPIMADGRLAPVISQLWDRRPLVLWGTTERSDSDRVSSCSLVGLHAYASAYRQLGQPFEIVYGHPDDHATQQDLERASRLTFAADRLKRSKVGLVGYHAPGFINVHADPVALSRALGVALHHMGIQEFVDVVNDIDESAVEADVTESLALGLPMDNVTPDDLAPSSRYYLGIKQLMQAEGLDALALRCWPELSQRLGSWPYFALARLADQGHSVALEGDVEAALLMRAGRLLDFGPAFLSDWIEHDSQTITLWHLGNAPLALCEPVESARGPRLGLHFNNNKPLVVNAALAPGRPVTLARLWRCDNAFHLTAVNAETIPPKRTILGSHALVRLPDRNVREWFESLCHAGMPHHPIVFAGHRAHTLKRFARLTDVLWMD